MIKAVYIDIDGTLVNDKREISDNTLIAIRKCIDNNIKIILASGRSRLQTSEYQERIGGSPYTISSNGADIYDLEKNKEIYIENIPKSVLEVLFEFANKNEYKITLNYDFELSMNTMFYPDEQDRVKSKEYLKDVIEKRKVVQCVISNRDIEKIRVFKNFLEEEKIGLKIENESKKLRDSSLPPSKHYYCDLVSKNASKGEAVKKVCEYLNLKNNEIAAIGDGINDVTMFKLTPYSIAMGNAGNIVKENANYVTDSNNDDGVAKILNKILKNEL